MKNAQTPKSSCSCTCTLRRLPLGVPLAIAAIGTIATIKADTRLHIGFGMAWAALSALHCWQHTPKMKNDLAKALEFLKTGQGKRPDAYTLALARAHAHAASSGI